MSDTPEYDFMEAPGWKRLVTQNLSDLPSDVRDGTEAHELSSGTTYTRVEGEWYPDKYLLCPKCEHSVWVSPVDPDATVGTMFNHLMTKHTNNSTQAAYRLLAAVTESNEG